jgi:hypothetical protein
MVITPRRVSRPLVCLVVVVVWLQAGVASALPIGDFSWDDDEFGLFGPFFTVTNFSSDLPGFSGAFFDVFVDLDTDFGDQEISILFEDGLPIIPAGGAAQSTDDLSAFTINGASLRLSFEHGALTVGALSPEVRSTLIDFTPPPDSASVPEPSTFGMVVVGLISLCTIRIKRWVKGH